MNGKQLFYTIVVTAIVGGAVWFYKPKEATIKYQFPYTEKLRDENQFACDALIDTMIYGSNDKINDDGIFGSMTSGTEKVAIQIDGNKLYFLTSTSAKAAVESGSAKPDNEAWTITRNDKGYIAAVYTGSGVITGNEINIVMIRKSNGMGVWTKTRDNMLGTDTPDAQSFMLKCL